MKKVAVVTGAGSGIGRAAAIHFHNNDYFVYAIGRDQAKLSSVKNQLQNCDIIRCDVGSDAEVINAINQITIENGNFVDVLVNNAGVFKTHNTPEGTQDLWNQQFNINLFGAVRWVRGLWPLWTKKAKPVSIVNVASTLGLRPTETTSAYSASKAALINWTLAIAREGGPNGIRANVICPGLVDTPIHSFHHLNPQEKQQQLDRFNTLQPLGRIGTPEEIASSIYFLASEESKWTTGTILTVDGGINLV